ncbi:malonate decarboxylase holo-ACP synthase [Trinickia caryophylli]|uniref:Phosphoribosyl-dephospho-CoA transferase n=1 Tax=Trinickia caryophylli TaxID=28094 RepID=A0A1X7CVW6_TRICW|nr:malonate decarboxylase holo-ACP synthase [Trinickia caryophylli]PMS13420.1 malonate decarboxylase holo-ACP synthase [Trinickia caryophylli]TRX13721.1 malonate decarboxylase holo-ACP synthase [Trinickia caryophylli]WQE15309.1 malonate decarboxylase holo-ACP synthase [Trinickia caryophylli]SMF04048.1 phosphoribosyl-dephospho-CoA transferase [Trinickia caryophylli]GLU30938.1 phosphoribosyl-dephospho-CoA transferase [Trinickia caryophylli]
MHEPRPHDLLKLKRSPLSADSPPWAHDAMRAAPFAVVRRAPAEGGRVPIGVRGSSRGERFAAFAEPEDIETIVRPHALLGIDAPPSRAVLAPFALLRALRDAAVFGELRWGPTGSAGFELATALPTISAGSDLDLLVEAPHAMTHDEAAQQHDALQACARGAGVRIDVQLETPFGGIALAEWAARKPRTMLRTAGGPRLVEDPWQGA